MKNKEINEKGRLRKINQKKIWMAILVISILLVPIIVNQHSLYKFKTRNDEPIIQNCIEKNSFTREQCEETLKKIDEEFFKDYKQVSFIKKYKQGFMDSLSYQRYWYSWFIPIILFIIYFKVINKNKIKKV